MIVGFSGTREGMSKKQRTFVYNFLERRGCNREIREFHHGDCIGSDEEASNIAEEFGLYIIIHPPINSRYRAFCHPKGCLILPPKVYFNRNIDIVEACDILIATPALKSRGTIQAIKAAKYRNKRIHIIHQLGKKEYFNTISVGEVR